MANVIIAFSKQEEARAIRNVLARNGFQICAVCTSGAQVMTHLDQMESSIIVCSYRLSDMLAWDLAANMSPYARMVMIVREIRQPDKHMPQVQCLAMPLKVQDLLQTVELLERTMTEERRIRRTVRKQRSPQEEALIREAKERLMKRNSWTEAQAHRYLQKVSMDSGTNMVESAQMVIKMFE